MLPTFDWTACDTPNCAISPQERAQQGSGSRSEDGIQRQNFSIDYGTLLQIIWYPQRKNKDYLEFKTKAKG